MSILKIKPIGLSVVVALMLSALTAPLKADGLNFGITASANILQTEATETLAGASGRTTQGNRTEEALLPSFFVEYNFGEIGNIGDGWVLGLDYIPIKPEIADETSPVKKDQTKDSGGKGSAVTNTAKADMKFHTTIYAETPGFWGGFYGKVGGIMANVQTEENLATGSEYPDENILGVVAGLGMKRYMDNFFVKLEGTYTRYETIVLNARGDAATNALGGNKIKAEPEALAARLSFGYAF